MPHTPSLPTPSNPSASGITYYGTTTISASALQIWHAILDFSTYPQWNTFTPHIKILSSPKPAFSSASPSDSDPSPIPTLGSDIDITAILGAPDSAPRQTKCKVSVFEGPLPSETSPPELKPGEKYMIGWKAQGFPAWSLRPERVQEIEVLAEGGCKFSSWETMAGPLATVVKKMVGAGIDESMQRFCDDLKRWVEGGCGKGNGDKGEGEEVGKEMTE